MTARSVDRLQASLAAVTVLLLASGCHDGGPTTPHSAPRPLPLQLTMEGAASSTEPDGSTVDCVLELRLELTGPPREGPDYLEYEGIHGGSIRRTVLDAQGDGIALWPDVYGEILVRSYVAGRLVILIPGNITGDSRFWDALSRFEGQLEDGDAATGAWECAPFDLTEGWVDVQYTARGTWTLSP